MRQFTIVAGPNGAGKSSFSKLLSSPDCEIFDADKVRLQKEKHYPDLAIDTIEALIEDEYWNTERLIIEGNKDLTVETNLRNDFLIERSDFLKRKGYTTNLIFMMLPDVESSLDRVKLRVRQKGHFVDIVSIKYNFENSLAKLLEHFQRFDNVFLFNCSPTPITSELFVILIINNGVISFVDTKAPLWAKSIIDEIIKRLPDTNI